MERDVACGKNRNLDFAFDRQIEAGHRADLRLYRLPKCVPVDQPGGRDQADQRTPSKAAIGIPRRFIPWAIVSDISKSG
jgi:hypothetical protein